MRLKANSKEQAGEEARFYEELSMKAEKEDQESFKEEEDKRLADELRLKTEAGGFCGAGVER